MRYQVLSLCILDNPALKSDVVDKKPKKLFLFILFYGKI